MPKKYYAVAKGFKTGIYTSWSDAEKQILGFNGALHKSFTSKTEAEEWLKNSPNKTTKKNITKKSPIIESKTPFENGVKIYTDGGSIKNPGPGGYGIVQIYGDERIEISGGFCHTTNNRMELMAVIVALQELKYKDKPITVYTDSKYVVDGITKGWAKKWRQNGWIKSDKKPAINPDLWSELLDLIEPLEINFQWIKGHAGNPMNERCDKLVGISAKKENLPIDNGYKKQNRSHV